MRLAYFFLIPAALLAQQSTSTDRILGALSDRSLAEHVAVMKTDDRIAMYSAMVKAKADDPHYQVLLAGAYVQKTRETTDFSYLERAAAILNAVLSEDRTNYEAQRLQVETQLEKHEF